MPTYGGGGSSATTSLVDYTQPTTADGPILGRWRTADTLATDYTISMGTFLFSGTNDNVWGFGYNYGSGGTRLDTSEPQIALQMEANYNTGSANLMEWHHVFTHADGTSVRWVSATMDRSSKVTGVSMTTDSFALNDRATAVNWIEFKSPYIELYAVGSGIRHSRNNAPLLQQLNGALNAYHNVLKLNASDQVLIGETGDSAMLFNHLLFNGAFDLGTSAANRPRNVYATGGVKTLTKAGAPVDGDFTNPVDGMLAVDTTNSKIYARIGGTWKGVTVA